MVRILVWLAVTAALALAAGSVFGPLGAGAATGLSFAYLALRAWLPRAAHRAFTRGEHRRAKRMFALARWAHLGAAARRRTRLSQAACELGAGHWRAGLSVLESMERTEMEPSEVAVWENNVAYALSRLEIRGDEATELAESALEKRPSLPGFLHTRGIALLSTGRTDDGIAVLESAFAGDSSVGLLESERCYDLARAWDSKGESDYATDYFVRAHQAAPSSTWATLSSEALAARSGSLPEMPTEGLL